MMWMVDQGERLGTHFGAFTERWFHLVRRGSDPHAMRAVPTPGASEEIQDRIRDVCLSLDAHAYFDLREPIVNTIRITLPEHTQRMYRAMEQEMLLALECGAEVEAFNAASKTLKCLQLANGAIYTEVHDAKLRALEGIIEEAAGMPVLVAYHFKSLKVIWPACSAP